ncbi:hypothetical protein D3C71_1255770 [compost metagenome]
MDKQCTAGDAEFEAANRYEECPMRDAIGLGIDASANGDMQEDDRALVVSRGGRACFIDVSL